MYIKFEGKAHKVEDVHNYGYTPHKVEDVHNYGYTLLELEDGTEYAIFESREAAGESAREYWEELAQDDPREFACIIGEETLVQWGLGQFGGPGSTKVKSLEDWLDLWLDTPEEHHARYDGAEVEVSRISPKLGEELGVYDEYTMGFETVNGALTDAPCQYVIYRHN
jgi:hypothetical protein